MKTLLHIAIAFLMISCKQNQKVCHIEFDEIVHYKLAGDENVLLGGGEMTPELISFNMLILANYPVSVADSTFLRRLSIVDFSKKQIPKNKFEEIQEIFCERDTSNHMREMNACEPVYRDILVFSNKEKVVGIAKICFECQQEWIVGLGDRAMLEDTAEYERLYTLLSEE